MSGLRPPSTPRSSTTTNLPAPGSTPSSLPTPRRKSNAAQLSRHLVSSSLSFGKTSEELDSLKDAMRRNDPNRYDSPDTLGGSVAGGLDNSPTPSNLGSSLASSSSTTPSATTERRKTALRRPSMMNMKSTLTKSISRPSTPSAISNYSFPVPNTPSRSKTPTGFGSSVSARTNVNLVKKLEIGDAVKMEVSGISMQGVVRFLGEVTGKEGTWGGVELDAEFAGQGKNDGSVKGDQYFACPPLCGLFLPLSKISPSTAPLRQSRPPSSMSNHSAHSDVSSKITAGSRASKYVGVTAKDLASKKALSQTTSTSPSKATPRKSISPEKLALSKSLGMSTPRATARPRASIGGASASSSTSTFSTPRQSSLVAPRANLGASLRRPPSSLRNHAPDVPAIPSTFAGSRSISGRGTPSTPGGGGGLSSRRLSTATDQSLNQSSRPATPSMRSLSRTSFASSLSRQSHTSYGDEAEELREARENEMEMRKLLEGSERLGREMEDKLGEREDSLKAALMKVRELEAEKLRNRLVEEARLAEAGDEGDKERDLLRIRELEDEKMLLERSAVSSKIASEKLAREWETKLAVRQGEIDSLRERMTESSKNFGVERIDLTRELDRLRGAGQALCAEYEGRISEIEGARQESVELAESLATQLSTLTESTAGSPHLSGGSRLTISQASSHTSAADIIDAENALAELEHTKIRLSNVEEQLEEARMHLESEIADSRRKKQKIIEVETMWKKETKTLRDAINSSNVGEARVTARITELEEALSESQRTLENERSELEVLRNEANSTSSISNSSDIQQRNTRQIQALQGERDHSSRELEDAKKELSRTNDLIGELRQDLRMAEKEIDRYHMSRGDRSGSNVGSIFSNDIDGSGTTDPNLRRDRLNSLRIDNSTPQQHATQDTPNYHTSPGGPNGKRDSIISNSSRGGKDEATAIREQIIGLKMIISTLTEENQQMADRNKSLMNEAQELRDAQRALEATVDNLMTELGNTPPSAAMKEKRASSDLLSSVPLQREVDDLKRKLDEADIRAQREIKALNQEVTELESLVESKIYREDELETELARYKSGHSSQPSYSNNIIQNITSHSRSNSQAYSASSYGNESLLNGAMGDDQECEMCGEKGHDLETCPIFGGVEAPMKRSSQLTNNSSEFCDDCEEYGHSLEACPLANEIF